MNDENNFDSKLDDFEKGVKQAKKENNVDDISKKEAILLPFICFVILLSMFASINYILAYKKEIIENRQNDVETSEVINNE